MADLTELDIGALNSGDDPKVLALQASIAGTLESVFGSSTDNDRYGDAEKIDLTVYTLSVNPFGNSTGTPIAEIRKGVARGRDRSIALLEQATKTLEEKLEDLGETKSGRALRAYAGMDLHPEIERAAGSLYRGGHYANAIEDALKALI